MTKISSKSISAPPLPTLVSHTCRERSPIVSAGTQLSVSPDGGWRLLYLIFLSLHPLPQPHPTLKGGSFTSVSQVIIQSREQMLPSAWIHHSNLINGCVHGMCIWVCVCLCVWIWRPEDDSDWPLNYFPPSLFEIDSLSLYLEFTDSARLVPGIPVFLAPQGRNDTPPRLAFGKLGL